MKNEVSLPPAVFSNLSEENRKIKKLPRRGPTLTTILQTPTTVFCRMRNFALWRWRTIVLVVKEGPTLSSNFSVIASCMSCMSAKSTPLIFFVKKAKSLFLANRWILPPKASKFLFYLFSRSPPSEDLFRLSSDICVDLLSRKRDIPPSSIFSSFWSSRIDSDPQSLQLFQLTHYFSNHVFKWRQWRETDARRHWNRNYKIHREMHHRWQSTTNLSLSLIFAVCIPSEKWGLGPTVDPRVSKSFSGRGWSEIRSWFPEADLVFFCHLPDFTNNFPSPLFSTATEGDSAIVCARGKRDICHPHWHSPNTSSHRPTKIMYYLQTQRSHTISKKERTDESNKASATRLISDPRQVHHPAPAPADLIRRLQSVESTVIVLRRRNRAVLSLSVSIFIFFSVFRKIKKCNKGCKEDRARTDAQPPLRRDRVDDTRHMT